MILNLGCLLDGTRIIMEPSPWPQLGEAFFIGLLHVGRPTLMCTAPFHGLGFWTGYQSENKLSTSNSLLFASWLRIQHEQLPHDSAALPRLLWWTVPSYSTIPSLHCLCQAGYFITIMRKVLYILYKGNKNYSGFAWFNFSMHRQMGRISRGSPPI